MADKWTHFKGKMVISHVRLTLLPKNRQNDVGDKQSLGRWHTGFSNFFSGAQVGTIFFNGIQVKASVSFRWINRLVSSQCITYFHRSKFEQV
jgi:hypothetical protein